MMCCVEMAHELSEDEEGERVRERRTPKTSYTSRPPQQVCILCMYMYICTFICARARAHTHTHPHPKL